MLMYDTIKCYLKSDEVKDSNYFKRLPSILKDVSITNRHNGFVNIKGFYNNLHISISELGISLNGSLTKFYYGNNFEQLTRLQTELAIQKIEDELSLNIGNANMRRIDIAQNFIMEHPISNYLYFMGDLRYYKKINQENSIYYKNHKKVIHLYDKVLESNSKNVEIPNYLNNKNLLRYEFRIINRINQQLNNDIRLKSLYDENVYLKLIDLYIDEYNKMNKLKKLESVESNVTSKSAKDIILSGYIDKYGKDVCNDLLETLNFSNPKAKFRTKRELQNLKGLTKESELILELNDKVNAIKDKL